MEITPDELSEQVLKILFECGEVEKVDFSTVVKNLDLRIEQHEKSDIEKIMDMLPDKHKIEVIKNVSRETIKPLR